MSIFLGPLSRTGNWFSFPHIHRGLAGHLGGNRKSGARGLTSSRMRPRPLVSLPFYPVIDSVRASCRLGFFEFLFFFSFYLSFFSLLSSPKNRGVNGSKPSFLFSFFFSRSTRRIFIYFSFLLFFFLSLGGSAYRGTVIAREFSWSFSTSVEEDRILEGVKKQHGRKRGAVVAAVGDKNKRVTQRNKRCWRMERRIHPPPSGAAASPPFRFVPRRKYVLCTTL